MIVSSGYRIEMQFRTSLYSNKKAIDIPHTTTLVTVGDDKVEFKHLTHITSHDKVATRKGKEYEKNSICSYRNDIKLDNDRSKLAYIIAHKVMYAEHSWACYKFDFFVHAEDCGFFYQQNRMNFETVY
jgi:hypothetical protein